MRGAEFPVWLLEPVREDAIFGQAIEHAIGADDAGVDRAGEDEKSDDDDEKFDDDFQPGWTVQVIHQAVDEIVAVFAVIALDVLIGPDDDFAIGLVNAIVAGGVLAGEGISPERGLAVRFFLPEVIDFGPGSIARFVVDVACHWPPPASVRACHRE